ncbi:threonylcarbamoyl-AMP synthase [Myxococcota bacterium]|nr:threonylcarbamoyl-AMP synthase [Myxococcota bacterium]
MLRLHIKKQHPQPRHIQRSVDALKLGGLVVYPTDTTYGLGCDIYAKRSIERIYALKGMSRKQQLSFICSDLSEVARYTVISDRAYRIMRHHVPGPYTFILPATREVPKILQSKTRTVGIRIPECMVATELVRGLGHPIVTTTVAREIEGETAYSNDPDEISSLFGRSLDVLLDAEALYGEPSSVIDLTGDEPVIIRKGAGDLSWLE